METSDDEDNNKERYRYCACLEGNTVILHYEHKLVDIYMWCSCISGALKSRIEIVDVETGDIIDTLKFKPGIEQ